MSDMRLVKALIMDSDPQDKCLPLAFTSNEDLGRYLAEIVPVGGIWDLGDVHIRKGFVCSYDTSGGDGDAD